jgi:hypothetical protein
LAIFNSAPKSRGSSSFSQEKGTVVLQKIEEVPDLLTRSEGKKLVFNWKEHYKEKKGLFT